MVRLIGSFGSGSPSKLSGDVDSAAVKLHVKDVKVFPRCWGGGGHP